MLTRQKVVTENGKDRGVLYYQCMKFFNVGEENPIGGSIRTSDMNLCGIGGQEGMVPIWNESEVFKLSQNPIKMLVGITLYEEGWDLFQKTMHGVFVNLFELYDQFKSKYNNEWDRFATNFGVVAIQDGYMNLNANLKEMGEKAGIYSEQPLRTFMEEDPRSKAMRPKSFADIMN